MSRSLLTDRQKLPMPNRIPPVNAAIMIPLKKLFKTNSDSDSHLNLKNTVPEKILESEDLYKDKQRRRSSIQIDRRYSNVSSSGTYPSDCEYKFLFHFFGKFFRMCVNH